MNHSNKIAVIIPAAGVSSRFGDSTPKQFLRLGDETVLEKEPLEQVTKLKEIHAFKHEGFWQCMDHKLDKDYLEHLLIEKKAPWIK